MPFVSQICQMCIELSQNIECRGSAPLAALARELYWISRYDETFQDRVCHSGNGRISGQCFASACWTGRVNLEQLLKIVSRPACDQFYPSHAVGHVYFTAKKDQGLATP
ncbi:unnamed protein product [Effrenium voratum]|uniref:Uncharacterized protein n=1 Tax=Effrenium voratum TaxID=2562239 RepID=A0AA36JTA6_9DINO|nr:unnamed protein product [Effrenium voratum]CAJ1440093.1 unnamed protein product [Effrenium voratum]